MFFVWFFAIKWTLVFAVAATNSFKQVWSLSLRFDFYFASTPPFSACLSLSLTLSLFLPLSFFLLMITWIDLDARFFPCIYTLRHRCISSVFVRLYNVRTKPNEKQTALKIRSIGKRSAIYKINSTLLIRKRTDKSDVFSCSHFKFILFHIAIRFEVFFFPLWLVVVVNCLYSHSMWASARALTLNSLRDQPGRVFFVVVQSRCRSFTWRMCVFAQCNAHAYLCNRLHSCCFRFSDALSVIDGRKLHK